MSDWDNHLTTLFPEVRLKHYLEMRGADGGPAPMIAAQAAFWIGLLYDRASLDQALQLIREWSPDDRQTLREKVPKLALQATIAGRSVRDVARDALQLARDGLKRRGRLDLLGRNETCFLTPLDSIVTANETQADRLIKLYNSG